jgi:hypothetical protein
VKQELLIRYWLAWMFTVGLFGDWRLETTSTTRGDSKPRKKSKKESIKEAYCVGDLYYWSFTLDLG